MVTPASQHQLAQSLDDDAMHQITVGVHNPPAASAIFVSAIWRQSR
jgi:hypothetical protein